MLSPLQLLRQFVSPRQVSASLEAFAAWEAAMRDLDLALPQALGDFVGRWGMIGSASVTAEVAFEDRRLHPEGVAEWLNDVDTGLEEHIRAGAGVELEICADGRFREEVSAECALRSFNVEGVLAGIAPSSGQLIVNGQAGYLRPEEVPRWDLPKKGKYGKAVLRLDDGDTLISDGLRVQGGYLVRTTNVVTSGQYLHRIVVVYRKLPAAACP